MNRIAILGAGAVGLLLAAFLAEESEELLLLGRRSVLDPLRGGLRARGLWGDRTIIASGPFRFAHTEEQLKPFTGSCDLVIVTSRATDSAALAPHAVRLLSPGGAVLSVQNGLGNWESLAGPCGGRVLGGIINTGVELTAPGEVTVTVQGRPLQLGAPPVIPEPLATELRAILAESLYPRFLRAGISTAIAEDIRAEQWKKVLYNCALNAPAAVRGGTYREYAEEPGAHEEMRTVIQEIYAVARAAGIPLQPPDPAGFEEFFFGPQGWLTRTLDHKPSMLSQLAAGKQTEIEALNGAIERMAAAHGVAAPVNARHAQQVRERTAASPRGR